MPGVKIPVGLGGEGGKEGVLTGGKGQFGIVLSGEGAVVQEDFPLKPVQPQNAFEQGGLPRAVLPQQPYDFPPGKGEGEVLQGVPFAGVGFGEVFEFQHQ